MIFYLCNRIFASLLCLFLASPFLGFTQQIVNGKVISKNDQAPIPAATIIIKGTKNGTTSDIGGIFSIKANKGDVFVVTGVGLKETEILVGASSTLVIDVDMDPKSLNTVGIHTTTRLLLNVQDQHPVLIKSFYKSAWLYFKIPAGKPFSIIAELESLLLPRADQEPETADVFLKDFNILRQNLLRMART